ncbi:hypothetical protein LCGC14_0673890 [marine sediment metagenome]|uniref:Uncharacterized protein n=1 Tax=marine sediment metagenome TaxID=412755 RepID=A0A0F9TBQ1_9ZZZZ
MNKETTIIKERIGKHLPHWTHVARYCTVPSLIEQLKSDYKPQIDWGELAGILRKMHLGDKNPSGKYEIVSSECSDFRVGEIINVKYCTDCIDVLRPGGWSTYRYGEIPGVEIKKIKTIHFRDTVSNVDYQVVQSNNCKYENGDLIRVKKCRGHIHVGCEIFYNEDIPDVWVECVKCVECVEC